MENTLERLISEVHPTKNGDRNIVALSSGSNKLLWWLDEFGHEWEAKLVSRVQGNGCPVCAGKVIVIGFNDLPTTRPRVAKHWNYEKNDLLPTQVTAGSNKIVEWKCELGHEWAAKINNRARSKNPGCPICSNRTVLTGFNDLATTYPAFAAEWHPTKNGDLLPTQIVAGYMKAAWWLGACGHEWKASVSTRIRKNNKCPYCSGYHLPENSRISEQLQKEFHPTKNGTLKALDVSKGSDKKVWWLDESEHEWEATVSSRALNSRGCPFCSNNRVLAGFNDFEFRCPIIALEWHPTKNGDLLPSQVSAWSSKKAWWICSYNHEWEAAIGSRSLGNGCPTCAAFKQKYQSKPETELKEFIESFGLTVEQSKHGLLPKNREIDLYVPELKLALEYNGIYWHSEFVKKDPDLHYIKWQTLAKADITLIQIWEDDWKARRPAVLRMLARRLGVLGGLSEVFPELTVPAAVDAGALSFAEVDELSAAAFFEANHVSGAVAAELFFGLQDGDQLRAVVALDTVEYGLQVVRYAESGLVMNGLHDLLAKVNLRLSPAAFTVVVDNALNDAGVFEAAGFTEETTVAPDYMYVVKAARVGKADYTVDRFREDPSLKFKVGLGERELAQLNKLYRIWDAGSTIYRLRLPAVTVI